MARRNSRFVNQKIIIGNKSIQAADLTDSAKTELASDSDFVKSVVGYNSLNLTNTDQLLATAGALSDAGLLKSSMRTHESFLNGLNNSIQTRGDSYAKDDEFINVIQTQEFSTDSDYYLVLDVPQSYIDLQAIRHDSHVAVGDLDSWRQNDFLDSFWIDNVVTNNRKVWYDSAGNNSIAFKYKLGSVSVATSNLHTFFGTDAGVDEDTVIRFQILDSAKSTDAGAFLAEDDSNKSSYYTVLDSIVAPLSETILNREFNIPANLAFHKGSQDSFEVTYIPTGTLTLPEALVNRDAFLRSGSPKKPLQGRNVSAYRVRKIKSAFRFKTTLSDNLAAEPVWSRVSPKFKYVIPKPGRLYGNTGTVYGETAGAYRNRRAYFPFASETFISAPTVSGSSSAMDTKVYGVQYGAPNANYWPYNSFATLAVPMSGNYPEPQFTPNQEGTEGNEYGVMQGGNGPGNSGLRNAYGVSFTTFNKSGLPAIPNFGGIPNSPSPGQGRNHGTLTSPQKGYYMGGNNVSDSTTKRAVWNYTTHSWSNTTPVGYGSGSPSAGITDLFGMSNDTYGHYAGGVGTYSSYSPFSTGRIFPHSNDASLTTRPAAAGRRASNVTGNSDNWYMWDGYSGPANTSGPQTNRWVTPFSSNNWQSRPTALSDAGQGPYGYADGHWW